MERRPVLNYIADHPKLAGFFACLAIAIAFTPKTSVIASWICLLLAWLFAVGMIAGSPLVKGKRFTRILITFASVVLFLALAAFGVWLTNQKNIAPKQPLLSLITTTVRHAWTMCLSIFSEMWVQRIFCVVLGVALTLLCQKITTKLFLKIKRRKSSAKLDKGWLDCKAEAEESIQQLAPALGAISEIIQQIGPSFDKQRDRVMIKSSASARAQVKAIRETAKMLDRYSGKLDTRCAILERIGHSLIEGMAGWFTWLSKHQEGSPMPDFLKSLRLFSESLGKSVAITDQYVITIESMHGVSSDLNQAVNTHLHSIRRIRDITEKIRKVCIDSLQLFQLPT